MTIVIHQPRIAVHVRDRSPSQRFGSVNDKRYDSIGSDPAHGGTRSSPDDHRRVTFDRAVWTKPLAFAADAAHQLCALNRVDLCRWGVQRRERWMIKTVQDAPDARRSGARDG